MSFIFSVRTLRQAGTRLPTPGHECSGYFSLERKGSSFGLVLISHIGAAHMLGPLYEPRLIKAGIEGMILLGFEVTAGAAVVQEWLVSPCNESFMSHGWGAIKPPEDGATVHQNSR